MGGDEEFLLAIAAAPRDEAPPLVYADWLDERSDPRGEYLRLLLILESAAFFQRWPEAFQRLRDLQAQVDPKWSVEIGGYVLRRRRPLWSELSELFIDCEISERSVALAVRESGYSPREVRLILWEEVFPAIECNLRHPAGEWISWPPESMQRILFGTSGRSSPVDQPSVADIIRKDWVVVCGSLPAEFAICGEPLPDPVEQQSAETASTGARRLRFLPWVKSRLFRSSRNGEDRRPTS
jgi:uncharacterized protein (TIGR02996 family)